MKKIKLGGKLNLNKETISKLDQSQMHSVKGGVDGGNNKWSLGRDCTQDYNGCQWETKGLFCQDHK